MSGIIECGDCLELMKRIPDGSVDMVLTDPPYGITNSGWDKVIDITQMFLEYYRVLKRGGVIVLFCVEPFASCLRTVGKKTYRYDWIWEKNIATGFLNANVQPLRAFENIAVFYKSKPTYNPQFRQGKPFKRTHKDHDCKLYGYFNKRTICNTGTRYPTNILKFNVVPNNVRRHINEKPVDLLEYLIKIYTNSGECVLDSCMGSGSTPVACINTGRNYIGFELEPVIFDIAAERIKQAEIDFEKEI